jgi:hypothetical protein
MYTLVSPQITVFFIVALAFAPSAMAVSKVSPMPSAMSLTGGSSKAASGHGTPMLQIHSFTQPAETVLSFAQKSPDLMSTVKAMVKQKLGVELRAEIDGSFSKRFGEMMHAEGKFCKSESDIVVSKGYVNSSFRPSQDELDRGYMALANGSLQPLSNPEVLDVLHNKAGAGIEIDLGSMESESCLVRRDGNLLFAKDVVFRDHNLGGMPMRAKVLANGEIEVQPGYFHASGSVDAYEQNPIDTPTETTFNYSDFSDSSFFLDSDQFSTVIFSGDRAESSTRDFSGFASGSFYLYQRRFQLLRRCSHAALYSRAASRIW